MVALHSAGPFGQRGGSQRGKARFSAIFVDGWRLVRLADIYAEQAPDPRGNGVGRLARQFFRLWLLLDGDDYDGEEDEDEHHDTADRQEQNREH